MAFMLPSTIQFKFWTLSDFKEIKIRWFTYHLHCATVILILMNLTPLLSQTIGSLKQHSSTLHDYAYNFTCFTPRDFNLDNGHSWLGDKLHHTTLDFILELPFTKQDKQSLTRQLLPTIYYPKMLWRNEVIAPGHILFKDVVTKWSNYSRPYSNYLTCQVHALLPNSEPPLILSLSLLESSLPTSSHSSQLCFEALKIPLHLIILGSST